MRRAVIFAVCTLLPFSAAAQAYRADNWLTVVPLNAYDFEVIEDRGEGARGIWCAAAEFADKVLSLPGDQRLYVKTARGPSISGAGRTGVVFTADPARVSGEVGRANSVSVSRAGLGLPVFHALQFCRNWRISDP